MKNLVFLFVLNLFVFKGFPSCYIGNNSSTIEINFSKVVKIIDEQLSEEQLNDFILPYIEQIAINSEAVSEAIATLISDLFSDVFNENKLQPILVSAWTQFTRLDQAQIAVVSDKLTTVVEDVFINETTISAKSRINCSFSFNICSYGNLLLLSF